MHAPKSLINDDPRRNRDFSRAIPVVAPAQLRDVQVRREAPHPGALPASGERGF